MLQVTGHPCGLEDCSVITFFARSCVTMKVHKLLARGQNRSKSHIVERTLNDGLPDSGICVVHVNVFYGFKYCTYHRWKYMKIG